MKLCFDLACQRRQHSFDLNHALVQLLIIHVAQKGEIPRE